MRRNQKIAAVLSVVMALSASVVAFGASSTQRGERIAGVPAVEPMESTTFTGIAITFSLQARDEDDDVIMFQLTETPRLGQVEIEGNVLTYTPGTKTGTDKFSYTAVDAQGNAASPATISVAVKKNKSKLASYDDLVGNPCHYAALELAANGVMRGEQIGDCSFFQPNETISRSEFILMVSKICGYDVDAAATTSFLDDEGLSIWAKPYISTAAEVGIVSGYPVTESSAVMCGENAITVGEASTIVQNVLQASADGAMYTVWQEHSESMPWDVQAVSALTQLEMLPASLTSQAVDAPLLRQDASVLLLNLMQAL